MGLKGYGVWVCGEEVELVNVEYSLEKFERERRKSVLKSETGSKTIWIKDWITKWLNEALKSGGRKVWFKPSWVDQEMELQLKNCSFAGLWVFFFLMVRFPEFTFCTKQWKKLTALQVMTFC